MQLNYGAAPLVPVSKSDIRYAFAWIVQKMRTRNKNHYRHRHSHQSILVRTKGWQDRAICIICSCKVTESALVSINGRKKHPLTALMRRHYWGNSLLGYEMWLQLCRKVPEICEIFLSGDFFLINLAYVWMWWLLLLSSLYLSISLLNKTAQKEELKGNSLDTPTYIRQVSSLRTYAWQWR